MGSADWEELRPRERLTELSKFLEREEEAPRAGLPYEEGVDGAEVVVEAVEEEGEKRESEEFLFLIYSKSALILGSCPEINSNAHQNTTNMLTTK